MESNVIIQGDALAVLRGFPEESIDLCVTSPPYWNLRDYSTKPLVWDGDPECEHEFIMTETEVKSNYNEGFNERCGGSPGQKKQEKSQQIKISRGFCSLCEAWRGSLGLEPTPDFFISHLCTIFDEAKRVLKKTGSLYCNIGDSYASTSRGDNRTREEKQKKSGLNRHKDPEKDKSQRSPQGSYTVDCGVKPKSLVGIPYRFAIEMMNRGWILRQEIIWHKPNCLNGGTRLYAKTQKGVIPSTIKDLARLDPKTVELWDGQKWNRVLQWIENKRPENILKIYLRSGEKILCTGDHIFPTGGAEKKATELCIGDIIESTTLPAVDIPASPELIPDEIGWFVGLYLAEGSISKKCIQISSHKKEKERFEILSKMAKDYHGTCNMYSFEGNTATINIFSDVLLAIIDEYISGKGSSGKHLITKAWQRSNDFLKKVLDGYLSGDGCYDKGNDRWRLGFTRNVSLANDLRLICARLGYKIRLEKSISKIDNEAYRSYRGEIKKTYNNHFNSKSAYEIIAIKKGKNFGKFWDIVLESNPHLFSTIGGTLIHNCMPSSVKDRFTTDFEPVFFFTKSGKYYFEQQFERWADSSGPRMQRAVSDIHKWADGAPGQKGNIVHKPRNNAKYEKTDYGGNGTSFQGHSGYYKADGTLLLDPRGRNKRCVWTIPTAQCKAAHFATFPEDLVKTPILASCPPGGIVLDCFCGAGTTLLVAEKLGRKWLGIELSAEYIEIARSRIHAEAAQLKMKF